MEVEAHAMRADHLHLAHAVLSALLALERWKLNRTSSAVKGSPLWNFTFSRSLKS